MHLKRFTLEFINNRCSISIKLEAKKLNLYELLLAVLPVLSPVYHFCLLLTILIRLILQCFFPWISYVQTILFSKTKAWNWQKYSVAIHIFFWLSRGLIHLNYVSWDRNPEEEKQTCFRYYWVTILFSRQFSVASLLRHDTAKYTETCLNLVI